MYPQQLEQWDEAVVRLAAAAPKETLGLEKKGESAFNPSGAGRAATVEELAKQVCAFANASDGFLVYGVQNDGTLDAGVPEVIPDSRQPAAAWVEQMVPQAVKPLVQGVHARHLRIGSHHREGYGVLVVSVPLSPFRPHWVIEKGKEVPYIRCGEHSLPMALQTFLDVRSRGAGASGRVCELGLREPPQLLNMAGGSWVWYFNPVIELLTGPVCQHWCLELRVAPRDGAFLGDMPGVTIPEPHVITFCARQPLFPRMPAHASGESVQFRGRPCRVTALLSVGGAEPVTATLAFELC